MKTLLSGAVVVTCDDQHTVHTPGDVLIEDDGIAYVGPQYDGEYDTRIYAGGYLLMPGLINAHTHSGMTVFRSLADDVDLMEFLERVVWPREVTLTEEDVYAGSLLAAAEMLKCGVTTYVDMYFQETALLQAAADAGSRVLITPTIIDSSVWRPVRGGWEGQLEDVSRFTRQWDGYLGRIAVGLGPHAPYTLPLEALREIARKGRELNVPVNIHLVETAGERAAFNERGLGSTVSALESIDFFEGKIIAAHSIWIDEGDAEIFARHDVGVAHCPQSNAKLGAGIAPVADLLAHAVNVGLGTDGASTNNNLDLWEDLRLAPVLAKVRVLDPKPLPAGEALWMATRIGALAIHQPGLGVLAPGFRADIVMLDLSDTTAVPVFGPETYLSHLVYSVGKDLVHSVWVNGVRVVSGHELTSVDGAAVRDGAQRAALAVARRADGQRV